MEAGANVAGADRGGLEKILSELPHADMNSKAQLLYALSSILSCVATAITYPAAHQSVFSWIRTLDVWQLHELVFKELKHHTLFLFDPFHSISDHVEDGCADLDHARVVNLEIVSQTLRCSVRILPLLDFIDRNASLAATKELDGILGQLCSPARLFDLLRFRREFDSKDGRCLTYLQCDEDGTWDESETDEEPRGAYNQCSDSSAQRGFWTVCMARLVATASRCRMEVIFTLLEVYTDEFLLGPDLIVRLVTSREEKRWSSDCDQLTCAIRDAEASLEAAFGHVLLSLQTLSKCHASCCRTSQRWLPVPNLSLPASLTLLERFIAEEIPLLYGTQIVRFLCKIVGDPLYRLLRVGQDADRMIARPTGNTPRDCWAGGVDWSYCCQERPSDGEGASAHFHDEDFFNSGITVNFVSSILEQALLMYMKVYFPSDTRAADKTEIPEFRKLHGSVLESRLWEHTSLHFRGQSLRDYQNATGAASLQPESRRKFDYLDKDGRCRCRCCTSSDILVDNQDAQSKVSLSRSGSSDIYLSRRDGHTGICCFPMNGADDFDANEEEKEDEVSGFVIALLQLMSCALDRLCQEVCLLVPRMPEPSEDHRQFPDGRSIPLRQADYKSDFDKILDCKGLHLTSCLPAVSSNPCLISEVGSCSRKHYYDPELRSGSQVRPFHDFAGHAVIFFANVLRGEAQKGAPDTVLEEYFHLLESLVALLLSLHKRNERGQSYGADHCDSPPCHRLLSDDELSRRAALEVPFPGEECGVCCGFRHNVHKQQQLEQLPYEVSSAQFLDQMAHCLQGILDDLSGQQRSMPEFLLLFAFKQVSKRDGLRIVTIVFISFLHQQVDVEQVIGHSRTQSVWSGGLVTQMLQLALTEPTRSSSLLTFIGYMIDILQDVPPIVPSLSLSEIADLIWWYENMAHSLTLASQLAVSEHDKFTKMGREQFVCWISRMGDGIKRLLTEGAAAARWVFDLSNSMSESAWQELTRGAAWQTTEEANGISGHWLPKDLKDAENFAKCSGFLSQLDVLRKAVKTLGNIGESFLGSEFANWLEKGRAFFEDLSHLLAGKKLSGPQWSEYVALFDRQDKCDLQTHLSSSRSVILDPEFDGVSGQKVDSQPRVDREHAAGAVEDEVRQEAYERSPACSGTATGDDVQMHENPSACADRTAELDQNLQTRRGFLERSIKTREESDRLDEEQEGIGDAADSRTSVTEYPISIPVIVEGKKQQESVAPVTSREEYVVGGVAKCMEEVGVSAENPSLHIVQRKRWSISTSAIIKRLMHKPMRSIRSIAQDIDHRPPLGSLEMTQTSGGKVSMDDFLDDDEDWESLCLSPNSTNPYIDYQHSKDPSKESFDDLKDFIVPKRGRNYSVWLERRKRLRKRVHHKNILPRIQEKKELLLLLEM